MKLDIRADHQALAAFLHDYMNRRLRTMLDRFASSVTRMTVEVGDANGPRGGVDKYCQITARVVEIGDVFAEAADADVQVAIDRAVSRIERAVGRTIVRARARDSETVRKPAPDGAVEQG